MSKKTVFQKLSEQFNTNVGNISRFIDLSDRKEYIAKNIDEYNRIKLEKQQQKFLNSLWVKVENEVYRNSVNYETTRLAAYSDFESMEFYPEISAALDIFMEESTTVDSNGKMLNIYSKSKRIVKILEDLFYNRLDLHSVLPMWVRNLCKYGDNFILLNINNKNGIIGARQLPNIEIERREGNLKKQINDDGTLKEQKVEFVWRSNNITFKPWQVIHFRLLGDDRRLPYGTSILEKSRRIWKQLVLAEDAMLIYRVTRAAERRIYKIYVGNIDDEDVYSYVNEIANRFKRSPIIDPKTGQIDLRYNQLANDQDIFIPVRDENAPSPIEVLPGAQNLSDIADIEYLQKKLLSSLRIPKEFIGFEEAVGEGKNLALKDIRFSRTVNRIQQSILRGLNQIAITHLLILGFEDELTNFTLTLNNPSNQAEMLKVEQMQQKIQLFHDATRDIGNGFAPMSMTKAKELILGWNESDIKLDFLQQRLEAAASNEIKNTSNVIKNSGLFDEVDKLYGNPDYGNAENGEEENNEEIGGMVGTPSVGNAFEEIGSEENVETNEENVEESYEKLKNKTIITNTKPYSKEFIINESIDGIIKEINDILTKDNQ
jgi:hypothetical protein